MEIIYSILEPYNRLLGLQKIASDLHYRKMLFVVQQPVEEGTLIYNTLTKALVLLTHKETYEFNANPLSNRQLVELWFAVPDKYDDLQLSRQITTVAKMITNPVNNITHYTIFTTTDCNARCFYCFEKGRERITMNEETAKEIAEYIISHSGRKPVTIEWFGGEPLYNKQVITIISNILQESNIQFHSKMLSNGYLMDSYTIQEAIELWNLKKVQITLDGTEQVYNRLKAFIYHNGSPFCRVINNIHSMLRAGIKVSIRLNIDLHNFKDLFLLADQLHKEFTDERGLTVYSHALYGSSLKNAAVNDSSTRQFIYIKQKELSEKLQEYGLSKTILLRRTIKKNHCMADSESAITILPNGKIGKCNQFSDDNFIGHIQSESFDQQTIKDFKRLYKDTMEVCNKCSYNPECMKLLKCPSKKNCFPEDREQLLQHLKQSMIYTYNKYKRQSI